MSALPASRTAPAVELRGVTVRYGALTAVRSASLEVAPGEVHALVGENGAGKSTLMRALYGLTPMSAGELRVGGAIIERPSPEAAIRAGIGMVHQHFLLVDTLSVAENVVLGREPTRGGLFDPDRAAAEVEKLAADHGIRFARAGWARGRLDRLSLGERQRVEILKVLYRGARVLILDEPTAVLTPPEVDELFQVLREFCAAGGAAVLVTHKLDEIMALSRRVTVMRQGAVQGTLATAGTTPSAIARLMIGRDLAASAAPPVGAVGRTLLAVEDLTIPGALEAISFEVREGEILGVAGVLGNGQTELAEAITGLRPVARGAVRLDGVDLGGADPAERRWRGLAHVPEDRQERGLILDFTVADNLILGRDREFRRPGLLRPLIDRARRDAQARVLLERLDVRPPDPAAPARALSGGNQQKIVLARELAGQPKVLVAAQPTRGVDVGAIERIHAELDGMRRRGGAVLLISAELDELLTLADRIAVLYRGRIVAVVARADASRAILAPLMTGVVAK